MCLSPHTASPSRRRLHTHLQSRALGPELGGRARSAGGTRRQGRKAAPRVAGREVGGSAGRGSALPECSAASSPPWQLARPASEVPAGENVVHKASLKLERIGQRETRRRPRHGLHTFPQITVMVWSAEPHFIRKARPKTQQTPLAPVISVPDTHQLKPQLSWLISR